MRQKKTISRNVAKWSCNGVEAVEAIRSIKWIAVPTPVLSGSGIRVCSQPREPQHPVLLHKDSK